jgi:CBS domain-containing protein
MSARAAARLESLGFTAVVRYTAGKVDWAANGWPIDGEAARQPRTASLLRTDLLTCGPDERLVEVQQRRPRAGEPGLAVVVNRDRVVLGVLDSQALERAPVDRRVAEVMKRAPSTLRPNVPLDEAEQWMTREEREHVLITTPDGTLLGVLHRADIARGARAA